MNKKTKTKSDMKVITDLFTSIGEERAPGQITPKDLVSIMARFLLGVLKKDGTTEQSWKTLKMCRMHLLKIILDTTICQEWKQMIY